jgi:hypothetical protein
LIAEKYPTAFQDSFDKRDWKYRVMIRWHRLTYDLFDGFPWYQVDREKEFVEKLDLQGLREGCR